MVGSHGQVGIVSEEANDVEVGHAGLDHHDVGALSLIQASLPECLPVVGWVLLVGFLVGWDDAPFLPCTCRNPLLACKQQTASAVDRGKTAYLKRWIPETTIWRHFEGTTPLLNSLLFLYPGMTNVEKDVEYNMAIHNSI